MENPTGNPQPQKKYFVVSSDRHVHELISSQRKHGKRLP